MSTPGAAAVAGPGTRGRLTVATVSLMIVAAAILGLVLGGSLSGGDDAPPARRPAAAVPLTIAHDGLRLQVPNGWTRGDAMSVLGFNRPLGLRNRNDSIRATVELLPASSATLIPAAFLETLRSAQPRPELVSLAAGRHAWRYNVPEEDGSVTVLYAAPTSIGVATVACMNPIDSGVPRGCDAVAKAISVPGSRALEPGARAAFDSRLPAVVSDLDAARAKGVRELSAATKPAAQAAAAGTLARAHKAAAEALTPLTAGRESLPAATVRALTATATAYAALASAARARSPQLYAAAAGAVRTADSDLRRSLRRIAAAAKAPAKVEARTPAKAKTPAKPVAKVNAKAKAQAKSKPAAKPKPVAKSKPTAKPKSKPAASTSQGFDISLPLIGLLVVLAIFLAVRETVRVLRQA